MSEQNYSPPVDKLLTYGECDFGEEWPDYLEFGLTREHIPELIRMAADTELRWADEDIPEGWVPVHAWRAIGQLRAEEAIEPLMNLFHELDDDDWASEELPVVYEMIGPHAVPALAGYLSKASHGTYPRTTAAHSLERIGNAYPEAREQCVSALTRQLERFAQNDPTFNALLIN